jgi:flagellar motor switch protein FliN
MSSTEAVVTNETNAIQNPGGEPLLDPSKLGILNDVTIVLSIEIGRANIKIKDLLNLSKDSVIDLNKVAGEPVDIFANGKLIAKGNIITANGKYCVRLTSMPEST